MNKINQQIRVGKMAMMIAFLMFFFGVGFVPAAAYFTAPAEATTNNFSAGTLSITANPDKSNLAISSSFGDNFTFNTTNTGSVNEQYRIEAVPTNCKAGFWNNLAMTVTKGTVVYDGFANSLLATSTTGGTWSVAINATSSFSAVQNETCDFVVNVTAWQNEFSDDVSGGFTATTTFSMTVTATEAVGPQTTSNVVLNEIYPNPDNSLSAPLEREWVELYNGTETSIDVEGWSIGETAGSSSEQLHIISLSNTCQSNSKIGFARPYNAASTNIPAGGRLLIEFCVSSRLNDSGDTVTLYNTSSTLLDSYTYTLTPKGKSIARIPDGSVWVDPVPTPGTPNTATREELETAGWSQADIDAVLGREVEHLGEAGEPKFKFLEADNGTSTATSTKKASDTGTSTTATTTQPSTAVATTTATTTDDIINDSAEDIKDNGDISTTTDPVFKDEKTNDGDVSPEGSSNSDKNTDKDDGSSTESNPSETAAAETKPPAEKVPVSTPEIKPEEGVIKEDNNETE